MNTVHQVFRALNPASRAPGQFAHGGGATSKHFRCVYCGARGESYCGRYRVTNKAYAFIETHECPEIARLAALVVNQ